MARKNEEPAAAEGGSFEKELARLEAIVGKLEAGSLGLDESIRLYEEGVRSLKAAQARLAGAEAKIKQLAEGASGPELQDFDAQKAEPPDQSDKSNAADPAPQPKARKPRGRGLF